MLYGILCHYGAGALRGLRGDARSARLHVRAPAKGVAAYGRDFHAETRGLHVSA